MLFSGHLISKFGITEADWHRIKQNIDSKCRTAFRRKQRGMPLTVKAFRGKSASYISPNTPGELITSDDDSLTQDDSGLTIHHVRLYKYSILNFDNLTSYLHIVQYSVPLCIVCVLISITSVSGWVSEREESFSLTSH